MSLKDAIQLAEKGEYEIQHLEKALNTFTGEEFHSLITKDLNNLVERIDYLVKLMNISKSSAFFKIIVDRVREEIEKRKIEEIREMILQ